MAGISRVSKDFIFAIRFLRDFFWLEGFTKDLKLTFLLKIKLLHKFAFSLHITPFLEFSSSDA